MLKHLALSDEHYWFSCVVGGATLGYLPEGPRADWEVGPEETADAVLGLYRQEIELSDEIIAATGLDQPPKQPDPA